ncbi:MAG: sulfotransferase [Rhodospirillaceae bacterium]|nr:sulfotransferase [Rhodospirillaceae bacterium]
MARLIDSDALVHIGLHKTGTTWLQFHLFPRADCGFHLPEFEGMTPKQRAKAIGVRLCYDQANRLMAEVDFDAIATREALAGLTVPEGKTAVVSHERLGGHPLSAGFDRTILRDRIRTVLPNARILVVVREQFSMLMSSYLQYLKYGGWHDLEQYLYPPSDGRLPTLNIDFWKYDRLIELYRSAFGPDRVLVLPYEMLVRNPQDLVERICDFAGVSVPDGVDGGRRENSRRGYAAAYWFRRLTWINRRTSANAFRPSRLPPWAGKVFDRGLKRGLEAAMPTYFENCVRQHLNAELLRLVDQRYFAESNRRTAELAGLDLKSFGYPV